MRYSAFVCTRGRKEYIHTPFHMQKRNPERMHRKQQWLLGGDRGDKEEWQTAVEDFSLHAFLFFQNFEPGKYITNSKR